MRMKVAPCFVSSLAGPIQRIVIFQFFHGQIGKVRFVTYKQGSEYAQLYTILCIEFHIHIPFVVFATDN